MPYTQYSLFAPVYGFVDRRPVTIWKAEIKKDP